MTYQELNENGEHIKPGYLKRTRYYVDQFISLRENKNLVLFIVFVALFLDNMLLTTVVPIIPDYLWKLQSHSFNQTSCKEREKLMATWKREESRIGDADAVIDFSRHPSHRIMYSDSILAKPNETCAQEWERRKHEALTDENIAVGLMFASKSVVQLIANPFVGPLTNRIGYSIPMFAGFVIMFISTIIFAFGRSYIILFIARAVQGIGSACSSVSGMGMLATLYTEDSERGKAFGFALSGLALGVLVGPTFGGFMYQFFDKSVPFIILAMLALLDGILQLVALKPSVRPEAQEGASLMELLRDPYILIAAGSITFGNMGIAILEPSLPLWMKDTMRSKPWEQGIAFLPCSVSYLLGTNLFGHIAHKIGRWLSAGLGMILGGICLLLIPQATSLPHLLVPNFGLGFSIGMVDATIMPLMGYLVDLRHVSVYGSVYAITDVAFCMGFAIGPAVSGTMVKDIGFPWLIRGMAIICFIYAPLNLFLRNPPGRDETAIRDLIMSKNPQPSNYATCSIDDKKATVGIDENAVSAEKP